MRNFVIVCVVLFTMAGTAFSETKEPAKSVAGGGKFRLPSEAQREYACRAGSKTRYCFGDDAARLGDYAWYTANSDDKSHPVGEKKPNGWGLYDMHGNVAEWCQDSYDAGYHVKSPMDDPTGPTGGRDRVWRGGSWFAPGRDCRSAFRFISAPEFRQGTLGLRVSRVPAEK
jgi:formylglycine-generating enzyme required for sulfatase activity